MIWQDYLMQSSHPDEDKSMEKLFLTGGSGFIGINVMECFLKAGIQVYNYDCCNISDMVEDYSAVFLVPITLYRVISWNGRSYPRPWIKAVRIRSSIWQ